MGTSTGLLGTPNFLQAALRRAWAQGYVEGYIETYPGDKLEAAHRALLEVAERHFGRQPPSVIRRIATLTEVDQILALVDRDYYSAEGLDLLEGGRPPKPLAPIAAVHALGRHP